MDQQYDIVPNGTIIYRKIELPTIGSVAVIGDAALAELFEYSSSNPSGVFDNKMWRRANREEPGVWWVCEYVPHPTKPEMCQTVIRRAASPTIVGLVAYGVFWWLAGIG